MAQLLYWIALDGAGVPNKVATERTISFYFTVNVSPHWPLTTACWSKGKTDLNPNDQTVTAQGTSAWKGQRVAELTVSWWSFDSPVSFMLTFGPSEGYWASTADGTLDRPAHCRYLHASPAPPPPPQTTCSPSVQAPDNKWTLRGCWSGLSLQDNSGSYHTERHRLSHLATSVSAASRVPARLFCVLQSASTLRSARLPTRQVGNTDTRIIQLTEDEGAPERERKRKRERERERGGSTPAAAHLLRSRPSRASAARPLLLGFLCACVRACVHVVPGDPRGAGVVSS